MSRRNHAHEIPCPVRVGPTDAGPIAPAGGWVNLLSCDGWWSNCNAFLSVPVQWANTEVRLLAITQGVTEVVATTTIATSGMVLDAGGTTYSGIALMGRGRPGSGWRVEARNDSADTARADGTITLEVWGTESTPEAVGPRAAIATPDTAPATRVSLLKGWDPDAELWRPVAVDASGHLLTVDGGSVIFDFSELGNVSGAVVLDGNDASAWRMTLIGDVTFSFVNLRPGAPYSIQVVQGAPGEWTVTFPASADFDVQGTEAYPSEGFSTVYQCTAISATAAYPSMHGGMNLALAGYEVIGRDGDPNFGIRPGFSTPGDASSRFEQAVLWMGPCTGAGPSFSGNWFIQSAAGGEDVKWTFGAAAAGPVAATFWSWQLDVAWSVSIPGASDAFTLAVGGATRVLADADGVTVRNSRARWTDIATTPVSAAIDLWYYANAGADVLNLPAGSAAIDGMAIGLTNFSGSDMTTNPDGTDEINGVAAAHTTPDGGTTWFTWHDSDNNWVALGS